MSIQDRKFFIELPLAPEIPRVSKGIAVVDECGILKNAFLFIKKAQASHRDQLRSDNQ
jgi:hypothetical protein